MSMTSAKITQMPTDQLEAELDRALDLGDDDLANNIQDELDRRNLAGTMEDPYPHDETPDLGGPGSYTT